MLVMTLLLLAFFARQTTFPGVKDVMRLLNPSGAADPHYATVSYSKAYCTTPKTDVRPETFPSALPTPHNQHQVKREVS